MDSLRGVDAGGGGGEGPVSRVNSKIYVNVTFFLSLIPPNVYCQI